MLPVRLRRWVALLVVAPFWAACEDGPFTTTTAHEAVDAAEVVIVQGQALAGLPGETLREAIVVEVRSRGGRGVKDIVLHSRAAGGSLSPGPGAYTDARGRVRFTWALPEAPGEVAATFFVDNPAVQPAYAFAQVDSDLPVLQQITELVPGDTAVLTGQNLARLDTLRVDGLPVGFVRQDDTRVSFVVPQMRGCEIDGRPVLVHGGAHPLSQIAARVAPRDVLQLAAGESRLVRPGCVMLPRAPQSFALSVANPSSEPGTLVSVSFRAHTAGAAARTGGSLQPSHGRRPQHGPARPAAYLRAAAGRHGFDDYEAVDSTLAQAGVGDTVLLGDFAGGRCSAPRYRSRPATADSASSDSIRELNIPTYPAVVVAEQGNAVVLADLRLAHVRDYLTDSATREQMDRLAGVLDGVTLPTLKRLLDPAFAAPPGAGGDFFLLITSTERPAVPFLEEALPQSECSLASGVLMVKLSPEVRQWRPEVIASHALGQLSQAAAFVDTYKRGESAPDAAQWGMRALESLANDLAVRLAADSARQVPVRATPSGAPAFQPDLRRDDLHALSPFATGTPGPSTRGYQLLRFAAQAAGQAEGATLGQVALWRDAYVGNGPSVARLARAAGFASVADLVDQYALAEVTDDLVAPHAVEAQGLPQIWTWDQSPEQPLTTVADWTAFFGAERLILREQGREQTVHVPGGSFHAWYLPADPNGAEPLTRGISLEIAQEPPARVRITRLR